MTRRITCAEADALQKGLRPLSSITNWINGKVIDPRLPAITATTWGHDDGTEIMREELDEDGCRHWSLAEDAS